MFSERERFYVHKKLRLKFCFSILFTQYSTVMRYLFKYQIYPLSINRDWFKAVEILILKRTGIQMHLFEKCFGRVTAFIYFWEIISVKSSWLWYHCCLHGDMLLGFIMRGHQLRLIITNNKWWSVVSGPVVYVVRRSTGLPSCGLVWLFLLLYVASLEIKHIFYCTTASEFFFSQSRLIVYASKFPGYNERC